MNKSGTPTGLNPFLSQQSLIKLLKVSILLKDWFSLDVPWVFLMLGGVFAFVWLIQIFFYLFFYLRVAAMKKASATENFPPLSIIICARNEEENLRKFLPSIVSQDYPEYEIVVVNDCSEDETGEVLKQFAAEYPHLRFTTIQQDDKFTHGKKLALTIGIKSAKYEHILLTDADCQTVSPSWARTMAASFDPGKEIVLGYGGFIRDKGWLNTIIRFDGLFIAMQYLGFASARIPYMGVGRNMAYVKSLFFKHKGFASHARLSSGDDDLFIREAATKNNVVCQISPNAITRTPAKKSFSLWMLQKKRHRTTFPRYKFVHRFLLSLEPLTRALFYFSFPFLLIFDYFFFPALILFGIRLIVQLVAFRFATVRLQEKDLLLYSPLLDILFVFIGSILIISAKTRRRSYPWR